MSEKITFIMVVISAFLFGFLLGLWFYNYGVAIPTGEAISRGFAYYDTNTGERKWKEANDE